MGARLGNIDHRWRHGVTRREALLSLAGILAATPRVASQLDPRPLSAHKRATGIDEMLTAFDFEPVAYAKVPRYNYDYTAYGTDSEFTLRRNREAFDWVELIPQRVLDVSPNELGSAVEFGLLLIQFFNLPPLLLDG